MFEFTLQALADAVGGVLFPFAQPASAEYHDLAAVPELIGEGSVAFILTENDVLALRDIILARRKGAVAVVSHVMPQFENISCILVENVRDALLRAGEACRASLTARVIAVTGTAGKTTTKELLAAMLSRKYKTAKMPGNLNTFIGAVYSLSLVDPEAEAAVLELGAGDRVRMKDLSALTRPEIGIVTNVGAAHLEQYGSEGNVLAEKLCLFDSAEKSFAAFLNGNDPLLKSVTTIRGVKPHFFYASDYPYPLPFAGEHFREDIAAAAAAARYLGVPEEDIRAAVDAFTPLAGRCRRVKLGTLTVIEDYYNANPLSMRAALELLSHCDGRRIAVLGDMLELGENAAEYHRQIGIIVAEKKLDELICIGNLAENIALGALEAGYPKTGCVVYPTVEAFLAEQHPFPAGSTVLLKASNAMRFDRIPEKLKLEYEDGV